MSSASTPENLTERKAMHNRTQPKKGGSPSLDLEITDELWATAKSCDSGACVIAVAG